MVPFRSFSEASSAVLEFLDQQIPMGVWMVTYTNGQRWVVLHAQARSIPVSIGTTLPYADSFCAQMACGAAPRIAPDCDAVPAYRQVMERIERRIGTYLSFPIERPDGALFGTLCALDLQTGSPELLDKSSMLELLSRQLSTILDFDLRQESAWREAAAQSALALTDALTQVPNRRAWDEVCEREEQRARDYGGELCVMQIDLDGLKQINDLQGHAAGDAYLAKASHALQSALRKGDYLARTGGDEFSLLLPHCDLALARALVERLRQELDRSGIAASFGVAERKPYRGLKDAWERADLAMYDEKRARKLCGWPAASGSV